jgi:hypothetical protein
MPNLQALLAPIFALIAISLRALGATRAVGAKPSPTAGAAPLPTELLLR